MGHKGIMPQEFVDEIKAVFDKHNIKDISVPDAFGQLAHRLDECSIENTMPWMIGGLCASYARHHDCVGIIKQLVEKIEAKFGENNLNYNDLDCNMWGKYVKVDIECLTCSSLISKIEENAPKKEECPRCKGTGIDPEFHNKMWVLMYDNHGYGKFFIVKENCLRFELHIRELPYNTKREKLVKLFKELCVDGKAERYDSENKYIRYLDNRDEGFVMSLEYEKPNDYHKESSDQTHDCEATLRARFVLSEIVEHFPCVIKEELA